MAFNPAFRGDNHPTIEILLIVAEINQARIANGIPPMGETEVKQYARDVFTFRRCTGG